MLKYRSVNNRAGIYLAFLSLRISVLFFYALIPNTSTAKRKIVNIKQKAAIVEPKKQIFEPQALRLKETEFLCQLSSIQLESRSIQEETDLNKQGKFNGRKTDESSFTW